MTKTLFSRGSITVSLIFLLLFSQNLLADTTFVKFGSSWKYLDNGAAAPTGAGALDWRNIGFVDGSWSNGIAEFGYGENDERTVVSYGPTPASKYITTYFRKIVNIDDLSPFTTVRLNLYVDDGAVIYVNGVEVARTNIAAGAVTQSTLASSSTEDGKVITTIDVPATNFVTGNNLVAVEVHQSGATSTDLSFDLELSGKAGGAASLFNFGSSWRFLDNNTYPANWNNSSGSETGWGTGNGELGYGDGDEATTVSYGPSGSTKYWTTLFRKTITISSLTGITGFTIDLKRDDGAVIYVNGSEVARTNMPTGTIVQTTPAVTAMEGTNESVTITVGTTGFVAGSNLIAVELHQSAVNSTDISFDMRLTPIVTTGEPNIIRGPLMQMGTGTAMTIKWRTSSASTSRVKYGTSENNLTSIVQDNSLVTDHEIRLTGLTPDTKYYFGIGSANSILKGSYRNSFFTTPPANTTRKIRIGVFGDAGKGNLGGTTQRGVRDGFQELSSARGGSELTIMLGDNAYDNGLESEHQTNFFDIYDDNVFDNTVVWPVPGNHEYRNNSTYAINHAIAYYDVFTLPTNAESGGVASGTEHYYSFDYGNIHFIMLDSYGIDGGYHLYDDTTNGPQAIWLKSDLAAASTQGKWIVVSMHHPPYTNGTHFSDSEGDLTNIRRRINPILERYGVDVVLAGHSHVYERSYLVKDHTGPSSPFNNGTAGSGTRISGSSAKYDGTGNSCPYFTIDTTKSHGTVYVTAGSAGQIGGGTNSQYPVFYYKNFSGSTTNGAGEIESGALYLEVQDNRMDAKFVGSSGLVRDQFVIMRGVNQKKTVNIAVNTTTQLTASWVGGYNWSTNPTPPATAIANTRSYSITPSSTGSFTYYVRDSLAPTTICLADTFNLLVTSTLPISLSKFDATLKNGSVNVEWTTTEEQNTSFYTIERSNNGRDFTMIMIVTAKGNSTTPTNYEFQDNYPQEGNNYYRLIATDKDGKTKIVGVKLVVLKIDRSFSISVNPNPAANGEIKGIIYSRKKQSIKIRVVNLKGSEVYNKTIQTVPGNNNIKFNVSAGTYILHLEAEDGSKINEKVLVGQ